MGSLCVRERTTEDNSKGKQGLLINQRLFEKHGTVEKRPEVNGGVLHFL